MQEVWAVELVVPESAAEGLAALAEGLPWVSEVFSAKEKPGAPFGGAGFGVFSAKEKPAAVFGGAGLLLVF